MTPLRFYFDFLSPYAYYARHELQRIAARYPLAIDWLAVDLQRLKLAAGNTGPATLQMPRKLGYALLDFERWAVRYGIPAASRPSCREVRDLNVGSFHAAEMRCVERYVQLGFEAVWGRQGQPIAADDLLRTVAEGCGLPLGPLQRFVSGAQGEAASEAAFRQAEADGAFGVPTMVIEGELWWGNDRLFMVEEHLALHAASAARRV